MLISRLLSYSKTDFIASFVGFVPSHRPQLTALVILDSPRGEYTGGKAAAVDPRIVVRDAESAARSRVVRVAPESDHAHI